MTGNIFHVSHIPYLCSDTFHDSYLVLGLCVRRSNSEPKMDATNFWNPHGWCSSSLVHHGRVVRVRLQQGGWQKQIYSLFGPDVRAPSSELRAQSLVVLVPRLPWPALFSTPTTTTTTTTTTRAGAYTHSSPPVEAVAATDDRNDTE